MSCLGWTIVFYTSHKEFNQHCKCNRTMLNNKTIFNYIFVTNNIKYVLKLMSRMTALASSVTFLNTPDINDFVIN